MFSISGVRGWELPARRLHHHGGSTDGNRPGGDLQRGSANLKYAPSPAKRPHSSGQAAQQARLVIEEAVPPTFVVRKDGERVIAAPRVWPGQVRLSSVESRSRR